MVAALLIFGPSKLPELGRSLGQGIREFKKATQAISEEVTRTVADEVGAASRKPAATPAQVPSEQEPKS